MPAVYNASIGAFIDEIYAAFILAAVRIGLDAFGRKHFAAFGIFCGLAMTTKISGTRRLAGIGCQWSEQVFPDAATPAEILSKLNELHILHILDLQSTISGFLVPPDDPGLVLLF